MENRLTVHVFPLLLSLKSSISCCVHTQTFQSKVESLQEHSWCFLERPECQIGYFKSRCGSVPFLSKDAEPQLKVGDWCEYQIITHGDGTHPEFRHRAVCVKRVDHDVTILQDFRALTAMVSGEGEGEDSWARTREVTTKEELEHLQYQLKRLQQMCRDARRLIND